MGLNRGVVQFGAVVMFAAGFYLGEVSVTSGGSVLFWIGVAIKAEVGDG